MATEDILAFLIALFGSIFTIDKGWFHFQRRRRAMNGDEPTRLLEKSSKHLWEVGETLKEMRSENKSSFKTAEYEREKLQTGLETLEKATDRIERKLP